MSGAARDAPKSFRSAGLYGGTRNTSACDVEKQVDFLRSAPDKNKAFASVARVGAADVPAYLRSLTPVQLRLDTTHRLVASAELRSTISRSNAIQEALWQQAKTKAK